ncbi:MAG: hypothetical protein ACOYL5_13715 [Phototrophicaceae bacterium]|jgi:hypothetical protein
MPDPEMDILNRALRQELFRFAEADDTIKRMVIARFRKIGALDWLIEVCKQDSDPRLQAFITLIEPETPEND